MTGRSLVLNQLSSRKMAGSFLRLISLFVSYNVHTLRLPNTSSGIKISSSIFRLLNWFTTRGGLFFSLAEKPISDYSKLFMNKQQNGYLPDSLYCQIPEIV